MLSLVLIAIAIGALACGGVVILFLARSPNKAMMWVPSDNADNYYQDLDKPNGLFRI